MRNCIAVAIFMCVTSSVFTQEFTIEDSMVEPGRALTTRRILFEFNKGTILKESLPFLDSVITFLNQHDSLCVEIQNHTDTRVSSAYSSCLSCNRAKSIGEYFISKGVDPSRLIAHGYQQSTPLIPAETIERMTDKNEIEEAHAINRRTVFKIIGSGKCY